MKNLRLLEILAKNSTTIKAKFSQNLTKILSTNNIIISSANNLVKNPIINSIETNENVLIITVQPLIPIASYFVEFKSIENFKFLSEKGDYLLLEDGTTNKPIIYGPQVNVDNPVYQFFIQALQNNIYDLTPGEVIPDWIYAFSKVAAQTLYDIRQLKSDNYLSIDVFDEKKIRGSGPSDRLNEEGAYFISRVGKFQTGTNLSKTLSFDSFPDYPIALQSNLIEDEVIINFDTNSLILTLQNNFITKVKSLVFKYQTNQFIYDIENLGYQLLNPKFDPEFASVYVTLENNQVKLNEDILSDINFKIPGPNDKIIISYEYKQKGQIIDYDSLVASESLLSLREVINPLLNIIYLDHSNILDPNNLSVIAELNGISFLNPSSNPPFSEIHPAFLNEIKYQGASDLPKNPGEYSVDYVGGRVFVYGEKNNDGSGEFPPTATYNYRKNYVSELDYFIYEDEAELVSNNERELSEKIITISFNYEQTLVPDIDFISQIHKEVLDERIENKLTALNSLKTNNFPITNVFRIFNETTNEVYKLNYWNDYQVYFTYQTPPNIVKITRERAKFKQIINEFLIPNSISGNILTFNLQNERLINASDDLIGSSFNNDLDFSSELFDKEIYFDKQTAELNDNLLRLSNKQYFVDYEFGIIYLYLDNVEINDFGTLTYKIGEIETNNKHIISVSDIYYNLAPNIGITDRLNYLSFNDSFIIPETFDISDERFNEENSYVYDNDTIIVKQDIKQVRGIYDHYNLINSINPINFFSLVTNVLNNIISLSSASGIQLSEELTIESGNIINVSFLSDGIELINVISVIRNSDNLELWDNLGSFAGLTIQLSGINSPITEESVTVIYQVKLNGAATPIVDYNRGDFFVDYTYLQDEIIVSYEYGDNCIDFHETNSLNEEEEYYVSYRYGALRDALLKNFGALPKIPLLNVFDVDFKREDYRKSLMAFFHNFLKGSTIEAVKNIVHTLTEINPEIEEELYKVWSLGHSKLYSNPIKISGSPELLPAKYNNGILIENNDQTISFPISSNLRLEEGTLEFWTIPQWNGLDNDATLTFELYKNNSVLPVNEIWIGASSFHPTYNQEFKFSINKKDITSPIGLPNAIYTETGIFIFYDDVNKIWKFYAKDIASQINDVVYSGKIYSSGETYQCKFLPGLGEVNDILRTKLSSIEFEFHLDNYDYLNPDGYQDGYSEVDGYFPTDGYVSGYSYDGISFMSDNQHYFIDFAEDEAHNRFSIFKDGSGYLNFQVLDKTGQRAKISADISLWKSGQLHHIGTSWKLNSQIDRDEMHLFIDGQEVPNIIKYGGRPVVEDGVDRFRTIKPEYLSPTIQKKIISNSNLVTTINSDLVYDITKDFTGEIILPGDTIFINESGFSTYTILNINGTILQLDQTMPASLSNAKYTINKFSWTVETELDLFPNIMVSLLSGEEEIELNGLRSDLPEYSIEKDINRNSILNLLAFNANVGDQIAIRTLGLNHREAKDKIYLWGSTNILKTQMPSPTNLLDVEITPILMPLISIGPNNSILNIDTFNATNLLITQPSNQIEGRKLSIRVTGTNVDFSTPIQVTIIGTASDLSLNETLSFSAPGTQDTTKKFINLISISVDVKPLVTAKNSTAVEIREANNILFADGNTSYPKINYSYLAESGNNLSATILNQIQDSTKNFGDSLIGQKIVIQSPPLVSGTYTIVDVVDNITLSISPNLPSTFTNGIYSIYNISTQNSGFQNGFFFLTEISNSLTIYNLPVGYYEIKYPTFMQCKFDPFNQTQLFIGSNYLGNKQANSILDEFVIYNQMLTDLRIGESAILNQKYITKDYSRRKQLQAKDSSYLSLLHFDQYPIKNIAPIYNFFNDSLIQSGSSLNENFDSCLNINQSGILIDNIGYFSTQLQGCIEFWINPTFDTYNDPNERYYFDASSSLLENTTSLTLGTIKVENKISEVLSVYLQTDKNNIGQEYFANGQILNDFQTIKLNKLLPYQQTPVKVDYIPRGLAGNQFSIFKDNDSNLICKIVTKDGTFEINKKIFWSRNTWHRVMINYSFNSKSDFIQMLIDGELVGKINGDINFTDPINQFYLGSTYLQTNQAQAKIDNLRLSNTIRELASVAGKQIDINYNSNIESVLPVITDVYTTYLLDFNKFIQKVDDFTYLKKENSGLADFTVKVFDSFKLLDSSEKMKAILESILKYLKPARSKITIQYSDI